MKIHQLEALIQTGALPSNHYLITGWAARNDFVVYRLKQYKEWRLATLVFAAITALCISFVIITGNYQSYATYLGVMAGFLSVMAGRNMREEYLLCIKFCVSLEELTEHLGISFDRLLAIPEEEAKSRAVNHLKFLSKSIVKEENAKGRHSADARSARTPFKRSHSSFVDFDLVYELPEQYVERTKPTGTVDELIARTQAAL